MGALDENGHIASVNTQGADVMHSSPRFDSIVQLANTWHMHQPATLHAALIPLRESMAGMSDSALEVPPAAIVLLKNFGVFRCARPAEDNGLDFDPLQQTRVIEEIARIDISLGWRCMIGMDSGIYFRYLQRSVAREMFPDPDAIAAGWVFPAGQAHVISGGFKVNGKWRFGSAIDMADVVIGGCLVYRSGILQTDAEQRPLTTMIMAPQRFFTIDRSSWDVHGLRGSGSFDYSAQELIVHTSHAFDLKKPMHLGPLTRRDNALVRKMPGVALGATRSLLDYIYDTARDTGSADHQAWSNSPQVQSAIAHYEYSYLAARLAVYASLQEEWHALCQDQLVSPRCRALLAMARRQVFRVAKEVASGLFDLLGARAIYSGTTPLERRLRDITVMCQHAAVRAQIDTAAGALLFGGDTHEMFV